MTDMLERLVRSYESRATVSDPVIREQFAVLEECVEGCQFEMKNRVCSAAVAISAESERLAYLDGLIDGARLMLEIMGRRPHR